VVPVFPLVFGGARMSPWWWLPGSMVATFWRPGFVVRLNGAGDGGHAQRYGLRRNNTVGLIASTPTLPGAPGTHSDPGDLRRWNKVERESSVRRVYVESTYGRPGLMVANCRRM